MADIAITGASLLGPGMALRGARAGYNAYKGYKAAKAAAKTAKAFEGVGKYRQGIRTVEGELLPREAARAAAPKRLAGPSPQNRLPPPQGKLPPPQRRLTGPQQQPQPQSPPPPSTNTAVAVKGKDSPFTPPPSGMPKLETAVKNMKERKPLSERAKARARRNKDLAAYERGDITQREYIRGEIEPFKSGGKVKKYSGKEGSEVKKDKPYLGPREQADVSKMEKMQKQSKTPIGDIEPVPGHYGKKKYAKGGKVEKESKGMNCGGMAKYGRGGGIERRGSGAGTVIKMKSGGVVDGCAQRGKTKGKVC